VVMNQQTLSLTVLKQKAENFCVYQERSHKEVVQKLRNLGANPNEIDLIVVHLIEYNFLNEERFARNFANGKHSIKKYGKIKIIRELKRRNISTNNIRKALEEISDEQYQNTFTQLSEKAWNSITEKNIIKKKKKFYDNLFSKGYEMYLINDAWQNLSEGINFIEF